MDVSLAPDFPEYHYPACHTARRKYDSSSGKIGEIDLRGGWQQMPATTDAISSIPELPVLLCFGLGSSYGKKNRTLWVG